MIRQIQCPACQSDLAYSAALLGRTVCCLTCRQPFPVTASPDGANAMAPPLPSRPPITLPSSRRTEKPDPHVRDEPEEDSVVERTSGVVALLGLIALFFGGFVVIAGGIGYLFWPGSSPTTVPRTQTAVPPEQQPAGVEQPKSLNDLLKDNPQRPGQRLDGR